MIFTVTASPSLDLIMELSGPVIAGQTSRAVKEELRPGGKGINISIMLKNLGIDSTALGFVAGFSGDELMRLTMAAGIKTGFIRVRRGRTRINLRMREQLSEAGSRDTRINGLGPAVAADDINYLVRKVSALSAGDCLVLAGAVPPSLPQDIYTTFCKAVENKGVDVIVDCPPSLLHAVLPWHPLLIKPNLNELKNYLNQEQATEQEIVAAAHAMQSEGARNVLVSLGEDGAIFVDTSGQAVRFMAPGGPAIDKTGAGDSMVAGFIADYFTSQDLHHAASMAVAAGSATALSIGIATRETALHFAKLMEEQGRGRAIAPLL